MLTGFVSTVRFVFSHILINIVLVSLVVEACTTYTHDMITANLQHAPNVVQSRKQENTHPLPKQHLQINNNLPSLPFPSNPSQQHIVDHPHVIFGQPL